MIDGYNGIAERQPRADGILNFVLVCRAAVNKEDDRGRFPSLMSINVKLLKVFRAILDSMAWCEHMA